MFRGYDCLSPNTQKMYHQLVRKHYEEKTKFGVATKKTRTQLKKIREMALYLDSTYKIKPEPKIYAD